MAGAHRNGFVRRVPVERFRFDDPVRVRRRYQPPHHGAVVESQPVFVQQPAEGEVRAVLGAGGADGAGIAADAFAPTAIGAGVLGHRVAPVGNPGLLRPLLRLREVPGDRQRIHRVRAAARVVLRRPGFAGDADPFLRFPVEGVEVVVGDGPVPAHAEQRAEPEVFRGEPGRRPAPVHRQPADGHGARLDVRAVVAGDVVAAVRVLAVVEESAAGVEAAFEVEDAVSGFDDGDRAVSVLGEALRHHRGADAGAEDGDIGFDDAGHDQRPPPAAAPTGGSGAGRSAPDSRSRQPAALMRTP